MSVGMSPLVRILAPLVASVLLLPGPGAAAAQEDPPGTTPTETSPPPADPTPPVETVATLDVPAEPYTITIVVPVLPERAPKRAAVRKHAAPPVRRSHSRAAPTVSHEVAERSQSSPRIVAPAKPDKAAKAAKTRKQAKPPRLKRAAPPRVSRPAVIRVPDHVPAAGVLAAQFSSASVDPSAPASNTILYLALTFAALLAMLVALAAAAPSLALLWPRVFAPVIQAQEQLLLAAACIVCAAITLAITWALTGPGA